jgi:hypothetical protein
VVAGGTDSKNAAEATLGGGAEAVIGVGRGGGGEDAPAGEAEVDAGVGEIAFEIIRRRIEGDATEEADDAQLGGADGGGFVRLASKTKVDALAEEVADVDIGFEDRGEGGDAVVEV